MLEGTRQKRVPSLRHLRSIFNDVNSKTMAGTATNYTVRDQYNAGDVLIGMFTIIASFIPRTTTVIK